MLELDDVHGGWGSTLVVEGASLRVAQGETVALLGRNGVGKSTLMELVVGRARLASGQIRLGDRRIDGLPIHLRARAGVAYVPQGREVFPSLTVSEHFAVAATPGDWTIERIIALFPRLHERRASLGTQLSGGEQQMLAIARALLGNPTLLLLDEPFEGLAPVIVDELVAKIQAIAREGGLAVLLVEQRVDIALALSDRHLVMDHGRIVHEGSSCDEAVDESTLAVAMGLRA